MPKSCFKRNRETSIFNNGTMVSNKYEKINFLYLFFFFKFEVISEIQIGKRMMYNLFILY